MKMNETMRVELDRSVLCWLATVSADGMPNVSPKEMFAGFGQEAIVIADIASPVSVRNIRANPKVCVSFIDIFRQRGFKAAGTAEIIAPDEDDFRRYGADLIENAGTDFPIRHVILVTVQHVARIKAPSYFLFPDRSEDEMMREAYRTYGMQPAS
ncbi:pyridoxamine 5'-phosphate oxidase family protein [Mesorhizobium sp. 1B3]|uniref:pyridoxamine 5'-phosphate oxidase family protein n=1 Tax=Mesorhizobium sp. 1B3 TaxID=3243599 RepID=UPI003D987417